MISTKFRSKLPELMDEFDFQGKELEKVLRSIDRVNNNLGGYKVTIQGILQIFDQQSISVKRPIKIVEFGCGSGASLRKLATYFSSSPYQVELIGVDANPHIVQIAKSQSADYKNIKFLVMDVFSENFKRINADVVFSSLTMHHFKEKEILKLIRVLYANTTFGIVINDLHRSVLAYRLFQLYALFFIQSKVAHQDGLVSILRGFKKHDFTNFAKKLHLQNKHQISWKWAFRYQWIIQH